MIKKFLFLGALILKQGLATEGLTFDGTSNVKIVDTFEDTIKDLPLQAVTYPNSQTEDLFSCYDVKKVYCNFLDKRLFINKFHESPTHIYFNSVSSALGISVTSKNDLYLNFLNCSKDFWKSFFHLNSPIDKTLHLYFENCQDKPENLSDFLKSHPMGPGQNPKSAWNGNIIIETEMK